MPLQDYQVGSNDLTSAMFQRRNEPNFAWANVMSVYQQIPYLLGLWTFAPRASNALYDQSGSGRTLTNTNDYATLLSGLAPYLDMGGAGGVTRAEEAALDLTTAASMGGWFWFDSFATSPACISKFGAVGDRAYLLNVTNTGIAQFSVWDAASVIKTIQYATAITTSGWHHICGTYNASTEISVFVDANKAQSVVAVPASIKNSGTGLEIGGAAGSASALLDGRASYCWLSAGFSPDYLIRALYQASRPIFGV